MNRRIFARLAVFGLALLLSGILFAGSAPAAILVGNGHSAQTDAEKAGAEAAAMAKKALGDGDVKLVLVFDTVEAKAPAKKAMLAGVASVFDAKIIYGCSAYAPITQDSNTGTVGVLAIGGDLEVTPAVAEVGGDHGECGKRIGGQLKKKAGAEDSDGQLVVLFGSCHVNSNDALVKGVCSVLGENFPVVGGAASKGEFLYCAGKLVEAKSNVGLLLTGDFTCGFSGKTAKQDEPERVIAVAGEAVQEALGDDREKAVIVFTFDCGGRRGWMGGEIDKELAAMRSAGGDTPLFGFYGSGETGPKDNESPACGVGYHIFACALLAK